MPSSVSSSSSPMRHGLVAEVVAKGEGRDGFSARSFQMFFLLSSGLRWRNWECADINYLASSSNSDRKKQKISCAALGNN